MTTTVTKTVKSAGGDYSSLSAWEAGQQADITAGGNDTIQEAEVYAFNDTTAFSISGWTTDATHYVRIYAAGGQGHAGYWDTSKYYLSATNATILTIDTEYVRIEGIQVQLTSTTGSVHGIVIDDIANPSDIRLGRLLIKGVISGAGGSGCTAYRGLDNSSANANVYLYDCVAFNFFNATFPGAGANLGFNAHFSNSRFLNCTGYENETSFDSDGTFNSIAINSLGFNVSGYTDFSGTWTGTSNNASSDATAPGSSSLTSQAAGDIDFVSTTDTNADFLDIANTSTVYAAGASDPGSGLYSTDIRARTWNTAWAIGANRGPAAGGTASRRYYYDMIGR